MQRRIFTSGGTSLVLFVFYQSSKTQILCCMCLNVSHNYFVVVLNFMVTAVVSDGSLRLVVFVGLCPTQMYGGLYTSIQDGSLQQVTLTFG